ncbi:hypothetical protein BTHE_1945 [Bifidobacterium thermophilum]|nr:hypothetical protein BTHE_1945 [Bifidobacterium thermophilum]
MWRLGLRGLGLRRPVGLSRSRIRAARRGCGGPFRRALLPGTLPCALHGRNQARRLFPSSPILHSCFCVDDHELPAAGGRLV